MSNESITRYILFWLLLTVASIAVGVFSLNWVTYYDLAKRGIRSQGKVTAKEPENHRFIRYSYAVGDRRFSGVGVGGNGNPEFNEISVGDSVILSYGADNPEISFLGDPEYQLASVTRGVVFIALALPAFILIAVRIAQRRRKRLSKAT